MTPWQDARLGTVLIHDGTPGRARPCFSTVSKLCPNSVCSQRRFLRSRRGGRADRIEHLIPQGLAELQTHRGTVGARAEVFHPSRSGQVEPGHPQRDVAVGRHGRGDFDPQTRRRNIHAAALRKAVEAFPVFPAQAKGGGTGDAVMSANAFLRHRPDYDSGARLTQSISGRGAGRTGVLKVRCKIRWYGLLESEA
jgi:hypothetical protein